MNPKQFTSDKILNHLDEVNEWYKEGNPFAITLEIDLTNKCNHNCPGCVGGDLSLKEELSKNEINKTIKEVSEMGCKGIIFTGGGEPLCHPYAGEAIKYAKSKNMDVGLITNGGLLHNFNNESLLSNCTWIRISLDAGSERIHRIVHGTKDFSKVVEDIKTLVDTKKRIQSDCTIGVGYLTGVGTNNFNDMMDFVNLSIELEVDYAQFRPFIKPLNKKDLTDFTPIDFNQFLSKANETTNILCSKHKYDAMINNNIKRQYDKCYGHQFATTISASGEMYICCHGRGIQSMVIGDIKKNSIKEIWNSEQRKKAVSEIKLKECPLLCRADTFNTILWNIKKEKNHINFL